MELVTILTFVLPLDNKSKIKDNAKNNSHKIEKRSPHYNIACFESMQLVFILYGMCSYTRTKRKILQSKIGEIGNQRRLIIVDW